MTQSYLIARALRLAMIRSKAGGYDEQTVEVATENAADEIAAEFQLDADALKDAIFER